MNSISQERMNYKVFRAIAFVGATLFIFIRSGRSLEGFYDSWNPISFFQLLNGPLASHYLLSIKWIWLLSALLAGFGFFFKASSKLALICACFYLGHQYNFGYVHHSTQVYLGALFILALAPRDQKKQYYWHLSLVKLWVVYVMLISGLQKLYYGGGFSWAFSDSFYLKIFALPHHTEFARFVLESPVIVSQLLAIFGLVIIELLAPLSLYSRKTGIAYFFIWSSFHPFVTLIFGRHYQFYSQIFIYACFLPLGPLWLSFFNSASKRPVND